MERNFRINPVGLKGNEINERMKQLMGVTPINEGLSRSTVELTKIGPDGKTYGIVRENHEYYIKVSDKTSNLTVEDFKYIGGLQNKKLEAYPSYARATKHLNLRFNSICESFGIVNTFNVFVDDNLLSEGAAKEASKDITDAKGKDLEAKAKEEGGDNVADKKVMDEMEEVTLTEDELAIDAMLNESEDEDDEEDEEENDEPFTGKYVSKRDIEEGESKDNPWAICTASVGREDKEKYEACVRDVKKEKGIKEELKEFSPYGSVAFSDKNEPKKEEPKEGETYLKNLKAGDKFSIGKLKYVLVNPSTGQVKYADGTGNMNFKGDAVVKKEKGIKEELKGNQSKIDANKNGKIDGEDFKMLKKDKVKENFENEDPSTDEIVDRLDNMSAAELIELLGDAGKDVLRLAKRKIEAGTKFMLNKMGHPVDEAGDFPDLTGDGEVTRADILKGRGVELDEEMTLEEIQEAIADLKKKL